MLALGVLGVGWGSWSDGACRGRGMVWTELRRPCLPLAVAVAAGGDRGGVFGNVVLYLESNKMFRFQWGRSVYQKERVLFVANL